MPPYLTLGRPPSPATAPLPHCLLRRLREGKGPLGALHGVPMTIKEHWDVPGWRSTRGNLRTKDNIATEACALVERLEAAGAVIYGKTNVPEDLASFICCECTRSLCAFFRKV